MSNLNSMPLTPPKVTKSTLVHDGFCRLRCDSLQLANGEIHAYYTVSTKPRAAIVVGSTRDGQWLIVEEYRHSVGRVLWGAPGGFVNKDETAEQAARRELLEETGYSAEKFTLLGSAFPLPGLLDQQVDYFHANNVFKVAAPALDGSECLRAFLITPAAFKAAAKAGQGLDGALCTALFFLG
jgi:ADP-ribose pyrophosphatase